MLSLVFSTEALAVCSTVELLVVSFEDVEFLKGRYITLIHRAILKRNYLKAHYN